MLLASGVIEDLASSGKSAKLHYRLAWSPWPGYAHVDDIRIVIQDPNIQFALDIHEADVHIRLLELVHRTFHATKVRGEGVVFRLRERIDPASAGRPLVRALPPIPGFSDPPLRDPGPPPPPIDDAHYDLWTVHIEDVDVGVREIWMDDIRYQGQARAAGAFRLRPERRVWVGPAELTVKSGEITTGPYDVLHTLEGNVGCRVEDFDVQAVEGVDVFRFISGRARLLGQVPSLEAVSFLSASGLSLEDGSGSIDADVAIDHGVVTPETRFAYRTRHVGVAMAKVHVRLDGELALTALGPSDGHEGVVTVSTSHSSLQLPKSQFPPVRLREVLLSATTTSVDLTRRWSLGRGELRVGEVASKDLRWLNDLPWVAPSAWIFEGGEGSFGGVVTLSGDRAWHGWGSMHVVRGSAHAGDVRVEATGDAEATFAARAGGSLRTDIRADVRDARAGQIGSGICPWAKIDSASMTGHITTGEDQPETRELRATLHGSSIRWGEFEAFADRTTLAGQWNRRWMQARADFTDLRMENAGGAPRSWEAAVASTSIDTVLTSGQGQTGGNVRVEAHQVHGQVGKTKMGGDIVAQLAMVSPDEKRTAAVSGVVLMHDVTMSKGQNRIDGWWAQLDLDHANLDTSQNVDVTANVRARVQNGLPVLYLLSSEGESPSWLVSQLARHTLSVNLDVRRFCRWTDVQIPLIQGGLLFAQGRVQTEPGQTYGAMLFRLAPVKLISVGVSFYEDHSNTALLVGPGWLEEQVLPMSQVATTRRDLGCATLPPRCE